MNDVILSLFMEYMARLVKNVIILCSDSNACKSFANLEEVERWVLAYGSRAQALEPPELVERLRQNAERMLEFYSAASR